MTKIFLFLLITASAILTIAVGLILITRLTFPYDTEGNYFDESSSVVYHQQSIIGYGLLGFGLITLTIFFAYYLFKKKKS